ncbi:hypothetical protein HYH03_001728 [Edaphochlamys debaryana]|uniref:Uncharacterized protein n=1 Tax=Edaphochlamys debaryana TaxID=47281 RepID=A0A835YCL4_9CHLO|nr:hypothetical protein HYH03_001728 [Edaphochlamys debaryana]|eukprot:KAG2500146.1 hypothetical protein HYH03_001728 [Edaphochlamys debaryana]
MSQSYAYERLLPHPEGRRKVDTRTYADAVDAMPCNSYTALMALAFVALHKPNLCVEDVGKTRRRRSRRSATMSIFAGMSEVPVLGGVAAAVVAVLSWGRPPAARTRLQNASMALQQGLVMLGCVAIQAGLPITLLLQWVQEGVRSFPELFEPAVPMPHSYQLIVCKALVATYILYWIHHHDATDVLWLLTVANHCALRGQVALAALTTLTTLLYTTAILLVYLVSLAVTARCTTPYDVILCGATSLFILDIEDVLCIVGEAYMGRVKAAMVEYDEKVFGDSSNAPMLPPPEVVTPGGTASPSVYLPAATSQPSPTQYGSPRQLYQREVAAGADDTDSEAEAAGDGAERSDYPLVWLGVVFMQASIGLYIYFLYRLHVCTAKDHLRSP